MSHSNLNTSSDAVARILVHARSRGVEFWAEGGQLRFRGPKGALTATELEHLRSARNQVLTLLTLAPHSPASADSVIKLAPLTHSQLAHYSWLRLAERPSLRQIASAILLSGDLDRALLRRALTQVVQRQEALRIQVHTTPGGPIQEVRASPDIDLRFADLSVISDASQDAEARKRIEAFVLESVRIDRDPLFAALLLKCNEREHILVLAMEHVISDAFSMSILREDLRCTYSDLAAGRTPSLSTPPVQFLDFAREEAQRSDAQSRMQTLQLTLQKYGVPRLPRDELPEVGACWTATEFTISSSLRADLQAWCRAHQTTVPMAAFSAYAALVLHECGRSRGVVQYQSDGRFRPRWRDTIGYFASVLHLPVDIPKHENFIQLLSRVTQLYCEGQLGGGFVDQLAGAPNESCTRGGLFNWIPASDQSELPWSHVLEGSLFPFDNPVLKRFDFDRDPVFELTDSEGGIQVRVQYPMARFTAARMDVLGRRFVRLIGQVTERSDEPILGILAR